MSWTWGAAMQCTVHLVHGGVEGQVVGEVAPQQVGVGNHDWEGDGEALEGGVDRMSDQSRLALWVELLVKKLSCVVPLGKW